MVGIGRERGRENQAHKVPVALAGEHVDDTVIIWLDCKRLQVKFQQGI